jgi:predicted RND superfamily exporter protein
MVTKLLTLICRFALARPRLVLAAMGVPAVFSIYALVVPLDFSFSGLMNRQHPEVARYFAASERYGLGGLLPLLLEGPEERLDAAVSDLRPALASLDVVESVAGDPPVEWIRERAPWIVSPRAFDAWLTLARGGEEREAAALVEAELADLEERNGPRRVDGSRLVSLVMQEDSFELALDADHFPRVRELAQRTLEPHGVTASFAGMPAIITQEQEATIDRMRLLGPISLIAVLLLLRRIERRSVALVGIAAPMLLSVGVTLAAIGLWDGTLTIMESVFGIMIFGMGVDFAIHLLLRMREERGHGRDFQTCVERTIAGTGRGILASAATTGGAFVILAFAPDPVFHRLGLAGGIGLLLCLTFLMLMLPAEWAIMERRQVVDRAPARVLLLPVLTALARITYRRPVAILGITALFMAWSAAGLPHFRYETNLERVFSRDIRAVDTAARIHDRFGLNPAPWLVAVSELDEARRITAEFDRDPLFERTESIVHLFPEDALRRSERLAEIGPALAARRQELEDMRAQLPDAEGGERIDAAIAPLLTLERAARLGPPEVGNLPPALSERFIGPGGEFLILAFASEPSLDSAAAAIERRAAQAIHPDATSISAVFEALIGTDRPWLGKLNLAVVSFVLLVLIVDLRRPKLVFLALIPVLTGSFAALGILNWSGFAFNTVTLVGIPLLLGLGVDDGIHIVHRLIEEPDRPIEEIIASVGRSIMMTTTTTCASVAALLFSRHPGIESIAILLLVGLPLCLLASVAVLPAFASLLRVAALQPRVAATRDSA